MSIGRQLRRLWVRFLAIEYVGDCLVFVWRQGRYKDQRLDSLVGTRCDHRASIGMGGQDDGAGRPLQGSIKGGHVI